MVGNNIEPFENGDLVLLGPNLPHVWVSEEKNGGPCEALVIQFPESFMQNLLLFPEWNCFHHLMQQSRKGLAYSTISKREIVRIRLQMQQIAETHSLLNLIELLCQLAGKEGQPICTEIFSSEKPSKDATRLNAILHFMQSHYLQPIILEDAAKAIHLSSSAFSKFFQRKMGKPFTTYLNELRIAHACQLLIETDKPISLIGNASGFENHSYFNRVFLKQKKVSPTGFRKIRK